MPIVFQDWLNANENRSYPLHDNALRVASNGVLLPNNILADASIWLPLSAGRVVYLSSVGITKSLVSVTFLAAQDSPFCSSSSSLAPFIPLAAVTVRKPVQRFKNYKLEALYPGAGGWVAFGAGAQELQALSLLFDDPGDSALADRCVRAYSDIPVMSLGKVDVSKVLMGLIRLKGVPGITRTFAEDRAIDGVTRRVALIGLDLGDNKVTRLQSFAGVCGHRPHANSCNTPPIISINDVKPDCDGNIDLIFETDETVGGAPDGLVLDYPVGLAEACPPTTFVSPFDVDDVCDPDESSESSSSSSSSSEESSSSSSSSDSSSSSFLPADYCERFEDPLHEFTVQEGEFNLAASVDDGTQRFVSRKGYAGEQFAINFNRQMSVENVGDSYTLRCVIRPVSGRDEGHIIFGYANDNNFFFAGFSMDPGLSPAPGFAIGRMFIGKRSAIGPPWSLALGDGYNFISGAVVAPPVTLQEAHYNVFVRVERLIGNLISIQLRVRWFDVIAREVDFTVQVPVFSFNLTGLSGLGVMDSYTEFDDFGINNDCPLMPDSIASEESVGSPLITMFVVPDSIPSAESVGDVDVSMTVVPSSIPSAEVVPAPSVSLTVVPDSIPSGEDVGGIDSIS